MKGLQSELLKYRRTFTGKLIVFMPIFFGIYVCVVQVVMQNPLAVANNNTTMGWETLLALVFNWWPVIFLPLGFALFAALIAAQEKKAGNYRSLRAHNVSPIMIWTDKIIGMGIYSILSTVILAIVAIIAGIFTVGGSVPFGKILAGSVICWSASLVLIPIQLWAATCGGIFLSMGLGFVGMLAGIIIAPTSFWIAMPWSWATRLMCPVIGVHPNNTILEAGNPLLNTSVIWEGIAVSLIAFFALSMITSSWFKRKEIQ